MREIRNTICGYIYPTSHPECQDPLAIQVLSENYCSSEKSCAEKVCESIGQILLSYERCSSIVCNVPLAVSFGQNSPSCKSNDCINGWTNSGRFIVYSNIHCLGGKLYLFIDSYLFLETFNLMYANI